MITCESTSNFDVHANLTALEVVLKDAGDLMRFGVWEISLAMDLILMNA